MNLSSQDCPKISIVTPSFNQGHFLEQTIQSVINQDYPNFEYIIIDGGSSDNSVEIIRKYEHHLHFWSSEPDEGHYDAINKGFSQASGQVFAWLNSDDMYCPWALKTVGSIFAQIREVNWLTTLNQLVWDKYGHCVAVKSMPGYSKEAFLDGCYFSNNRDGLGFIQQESTFWRSDLWKEVGGLRLKYPLAGDFDLWSLFYQHAELHGTPSPLGGFRKHEQNRSSNLDGYYEEAEMSLEELRNSLGWQASPGANLATSIVNKFKFNNLSRFILRKAFGQFTASNILSDISDDEKCWKIVDQQFSRVRIL